MRNPNRTADTMLEKWVYQDGLDAVGIARRINNMAVPGMAARMAVEYVRLLHKNPELSNAETEGVLRVFEEALR